MVKSGDFKSPIALYPIGSRGFESRLGLNYQGSTRGKKWQRSPHRDESLARWFESSLPWILDALYKMKPVTIEYSNDTAPAFKGHLNCIVSWASNDLLTFWAAYYYFCFPVPEKIPNELALYIALKGLRIAKKSKIIDDIFVRDLTWFNEKFRKGGKIYHLNKEIFFKKIKQTTKGYKILD